eukprot:9868042-Lingulodinium_polyedra.AAC.1
MWMIVNDTYGDLPADARFSIWVAPGELGKREGSASRIENCSPSLVQYSSRRHEGIRCSSPMFLASALSCLMPQLARRGMAQAHAGNRRIRGRF